MSFTIRFRAAARAELRAAHRWYENQRPRLGRGFLTHVEALIQRIGNNPEAFPIVYKGTVRKAKLKRFPYLIFFYPRDESTITILAVFHGHRDPSTWQARFDDETEPL